MKVNVERWSRILSTISNKFLGILNKNQLAIISHGVNVLNRKYLNNYLILSRRMNRINLLKHKILKDCIRVSDMAIK